MSAATRRLTVIVMSCLFVLAFASRVHAFQPPFQARQLGSVLAPPSTSSSTAPTSSSTPTSSTSSSQSEQTSQTSSSSTAPTTVSSTAQSSSQSSSSTSAVPASTSAPATSAGLTTSASDTGSHQVTTIVTETPSNTATASPSATSSASSGDSTALGTGSIIGLSVAGGVAVIGIIAFLVWKLTRKRFSDFDDNEAIKWPELNTHSGGDSHPLPVHSTGRAGFGDTESLQDLSRAPSAVEYADSVTGSAVDLYPGIGADPYAVPPLPHLNPNQPYHDDPQAQGFYDPYRGPVPNTFDGPDIDTSSAHGTAWGGEAIPLTQMSPNPRPGPQMVYDHSGRAISPQQMASRRSPAPQTALAYGEPALPSFSGGPMMESRSRSPGPAAGLGGPPAGDRRTPGPQGPFDSGYGGR